MLALMLLTPRTLAADGIEQVLEESGALDLVFKESPLPPTREIIRNIHRCDPDVILLDLADWENVSDLAREIGHIKSRGVLIGFRPGSEQMTPHMFEEAGVLSVLREPFSASEIEAAVYEALHREQPVTHYNILPFLPAKAGGGCSTVVLHVAAAVAKTAGTRVLLIEADRRSGILSIMLNLQNRSGLSEALQSAREMSPIEWQKHRVEAFGMHLLLTNPARRSPLPSWADYYHLLRFVQRQYDYVFVDLPEVLNEATAEVVRSGRSVFVVCTPEVPSLKMASLRCAELEACEIPRHKIQLVLNRWERNRMSAQEIETILERPLYASLSNDYDEVQHAIVESRLVIPESPFADNARAFARKLHGFPPEESRETSKFTLLKRLAKIAS